MITVSIYRSALDDAKETQRIENPATIKELYPDVDFTNSIISVNGFRRNENCLLQDGDVCSIRIFPEGNGADWLFGAGTGLLTALSVISVINMWNPIGWVGGAIALGVGIAGGAIGFGIASAAGWSVTGWLRDQLAADIKSPETLKTIPQLRGAKNQSAYGQPVPLVLGEHLFTPGYVGRPYTQISGVDGEDQDFYALYLLGYGKLKVADVKLGVIGDIASNRIPLLQRDDGFLVIDGDPFLLKGSPQVELLQSGQESSIYPQAVYEEPLNIELSYPKGSEPLDVVRFSAKNPKKIQVEITFPAGLLSYNDEGKKRNAAVKVMVQWRISRPDNKDNWKIFGRFGVGQTGIDYLAATSVITRSKTKVMRFVAEKEFSSYSEVSDDADTRVIEIRAQRINEQSDSAKIVDKVYLTAIRTWLFDNEKSKASGTLFPQVPVVDGLRDKTARLGFRIKATQNTQGMLDSLNCVVESKCRTWIKKTNTQPGYWTDSDWDIEKQKWVGNSETPSNNPAALALKLLQSPTLGRKAYPDSMLDMESFGDFYEWCDEDIVDPRTGKAAKRASCNGVLTQGKRADEVLALILSTGRAMRILNGNKYGLLIDKPRDYPVMILNSQNVLEASNQKAFADLPDGFLVKFINEADGWQQAEEYVMADGTNKSTPESTVENLELPYITNRDQVVRMARYQLACRRLRPEIWNRKLSFDGYLIGIGDLVEVQDDTIVVGIGEGAAIVGLVQDESGKIAEIQTDGKFDVSDMGKQYGVKIMQADGVNDIAIRTAQVFIPEPGTYSGFTFNPPIELAFTPQPGDLVAFGEYSKITAPALCFGKKDNGDGTFDVTLVPYQEGIYSTDYGEIPPYEANITAPQEPPELETVPPYVETINDRIDGIIENPVDVNDGFVFLSLTVQSRILDCDHEGNALIGQLPFSSQAALYRGDKAIPRRSGIDRYPGTDNLFDPMLGDFVPAVDDVVYSLLDPPEGVTIDEGGLIRIAEGAALAQENNIVAQAKFLGRAYSAKLYIKKGVYTPRYLGPCYKIPDGQAVEITTGTLVRNVMPWQGDWVAYLGAVNQGLWEKGFCMRWTGAQWEKIAIDASSGSFESNPYIAALVDLTEGAPTGTFMNLLVRDLIAKTAMIDELRTRVITLEQNGAIQSSNYSKGVNGFQIKASGEAEFNNNITAKNMQATGGVFDSIRVQGNSTFSGAFSAEQFSMVGIFNADTDSDIFSIYGNISRDNSIGFYRVGANNVMKGSFSYASIYYWIKSRIQPQNDFPFSFVCIGQMGQLNLFAGHYDPSWSYISLYGRYSDGTFQDVHISPQSTITNANCFIVLL
jgi:hypothetical protein